MTALRNFPSCKVLGKDIIEDFDASDEDPSTIDVVDVSTWSNSVHH